MRTLIATALLCMVTHGLALAQDWEPRRRHHDGVHVRVAKDYYLPADQVVTWPVIVVGGSATIDGRLDDELVVVGGSVRIGPAAQVRGEIVSIGGDVQVADTAEVTGEIHDISVIWPEIRFALREWLWPADSGWWAVFALVTTSMRFTLVMVVSCFLALVTPGWIRRIQGRVADAAIPALLVGIASEMLFVPALIVVIASLVVTVIGIPLLLFVPFVVLFFIVTWAAGFTAVAAQLGGVLRQRSALATDSLVIDAMWGVLALFLVTFIGNILAFAPPLMWPLATAVNGAGLVIEYLAWTVGLGAALLAPFHRRWRAAPPPIPSTAHASA